MPQPPIEEESEGFDQEDLRRAFTRNLENSESRRNEEHEQLEQPSSSDESRADAGPYAQSEKPAEANAPGAGNAAAGEGNEGKYEITEDDCYDELGYNFSNAKKWYIVTVIFWVQVSMNFNTSLYSNAIGGIQDEFGVSAQAARCGAMIFLVLYAFGCELWAPWSEELGRWPILQLSLLFVNIWQIPVALAPNFATIMVGRALGGLSTAGGSVTLGMIADLWESDTQQYAVAYVVFSSVFGSVLGPIVGGFCEQWLHWRWCIWIQLIFGGAVQILHALTVPETRSTIMMNRIAKKRRESGENPNIWGPDELVPFSKRLNVRDVCITFIRPFRMFLTEPIVMVLSLLSGFSDALIFIFIQSFGLVYAQWGFEPYQVGLSFIAIGVGYVIAWLIFLPAIRHNVNVRKKNPESEHAQYESRLWFLLYTAPCLPIGLIGFAWTSLGPPIHWMGTMVFAAIVGIANYAIYMATIDYMICAYGPYSASATGGNGWARDFLAGVLTVPATPFYQNIGAPDRNLEYASTILFCISFVLVAAVYVIYWKGPTLRRRSPFAQQLAEQRVEEDVGGRRLSAARPPSERRRSSATSMAERRASGASAPAQAPSRPGMQNRQYSQQNRFFGESRVTPRGTPRGTPSASRRNSYDFRRARI